MCRCASFHLCLCTFFVHEHKMSVLVDEVFDYALQIVFT